MLRVYKYELQVEREQKLQLPHYAQILRAGEQDGNLFLWALVPFEPVPLDPDTVTIRVAGTGHDIESSARGLKYIDTVMMSDGLVFHVFEVLK